MMAFLAQALESFGGTGDLGFRAPWSTAVMAGLMVLAAAYAVFLYRKERSLSPLRRGALAGLRALLYLLIIALLFEPVLSRAKEVLVPGNLLVLIDVSESMATSEPRSRRDDLTDAALALGRVAFPAAGGRGGAADETAGDAAPDASGASGGSGGAEDAGGPSAPVAGRGSGAGAGEGDGDGGELPRSIDELTAEERSALTSVSRLELARGVLSHPQLSVFRETERRRVRGFRFGERLEPEGGGETLGEALSDVSPEAPVTRLGEALSEAVERHSGQAIEGVVLLTDGASNDGRDPVEAARRLGELGVPVFPLGLGLPEPEDVRVKALIVQDAVFEKDVVPVKVEVSSRGYDGRRADLVLTMDGTEVARRSVDLRDGARFEELSFIPEGQAGTRTLAVAIEPLEGEITRGNNRLERAVRVIDEKIRVLYVEGKPRWEYRYLRAVLLRDPRLDVRFLLAEGDPDLPGASPLHVGRFPEDRAEGSRYDVVILGDVPSYFFSPAELESIERIVREDGGSFLMLAGEDHAPESYRETPIEGLLPVRLGEGGRIDVHPTVHPVATRAGLESRMTLLGSTEGHTSAIWSLVRPLYSLPRLEGPRPAATVLATLSADVGRGEGSYPLVAWQRYGTGKSLFVATDQLWRLRYRQGDTYHARFWGQALRFLTLSRLLGENRRIRIETAEREVRTGERVEVYVSALSQTFEPITADAFTIEAASGGLPDPVRVRLDPVPGKPGLFQGSFTPDREGTYVLRAAGGEARASNTLELEVAPFEREKLEPDMQEETLRSIAEISGGRYLEVEDLPRLASLLESGAQTLEVREERELWDHWSLFAAFLSLAGLEWFLRRRYDLA